MSDACIYTRISSDPDADNDDGGKGVARQEKECRELAKRLKLSVAGVYSDNDISAYKNRTRPGFERMLKDIKAGRYDMLICWHTDRLTRSMKDLERVIDVCEAADVPVKTVSGGDLDLSNATGKMLARIVGSVSRQESEHKSERIRAAFKEQAADGVWRLSLRTFGYTVDGKIIPAEAKELRQAAADVLTGRSLVNVVADWNTRGVPTTTGAKWSMITVKRLLTNPRHAALCVYQGKVVGPGKWKPILDQDTHHGLVSLLHDPERGGAVSYERKYVGSYRFVCGVCGAKMKHFSTKGVSQYRCSESAHLSRDQAKVDSLVEETVLRYIKSQKDVMKLLATAGATKGPDPKALRARREALVAQKDELATMFTEGVLDGPAVRRESAKLSQKIGQVDTALAELACRSPLGELLSQGVAKLDERWAQASPDIKGKILDEVATVTIKKAARRGGRFDPADIVIKWRRKR